MAKKSSAPNPYPVQEKTGPGGIGPKWTWPKPKPFGPDRQRRDGIDIQRRDQPDKQIKPKPPKVLVPPFKKKKKLV